MSTYKASASELLRAYYDEIGTYNSPWLVKPVELDAGRAILEGDAQLHIGIIRGAFQSQPPRWYSIHPLLGQLCKRHLPYTVDDIRAILQGLGRKHSYSIPRSSPGWQSGKAPALALHRR